jgi:hypothetical protein
MGRRMQVRTTPENVAEMRRAAAVMRAHKAARTRKADAALAAYKAGEGTAEAAVDAISHRAMLCDSHERLSVLLRRLYCAPREIFWPVFLDYWSVCDVTWWYQDWLISTLRQHAPAILPDAEQKIFNALPERVQVFRGCSRARIKGVSWTTERRIAEGFARGHRGIPVPDPVVVTGMIGKRDIFATNDDRNEHEVILDPYRLQELSVESWLPKAAA